MIDNETYNIVKKYKNNEIELEPVQKDFVDLLSKKYNAKILCYFYNYVIQNHEKRPRLDIIVERTNDYNKFLNENLNFKTQIQNEILTEFKKLTVFNEIENNKKIFVSFHDFEENAIIEAHGHIKDEDLKKIAESIDKENIWIIKKFFQGITIFLYRERTISLETKNTILELFKKQYFSKLKQYDEFNYCTLNSLNVKFDTKENFEENYQGSWFYYFR